MAILFVAVVVLAGRSGEPHADGDGVLAGYGSPTREAMAIDAEANGGATTYTFGTPLCQAVDGPPPVLRAVRPASTVGSGTGVVGVRVRTFTPSDTDTPLGSTAGFPPPTVSSAALADPAGFAVTSACTHAPGQPYTELLVGLELRSPDGGGWDGILVDYDVAGESRTVRIERGMFICGASSPCR